MSIWNSLAGTTSIELTTASVADTLTAIYDINIIVFDVQQISDLQVIITVFQKDYYRLTCLLEKKGVDHRIIRKQGIYWSLKQAIARPVLVIGLLIILVLTLYLPTRVLFVSVKGNNAIAANQIMEVASENGVYFFSARRSLRSEKIKNALLASIPQLQWAGVNTNGCTAVISVKERSEAINPAGNKSVGSVVAKCDGIVHTMTVLKGNRLCQVGQAVRKNQVLVSGYTDYGTVIKAVAADAEIYGFTNHELVSITPKASSQRAQITHTKRRYSIQFGKKLINLYKHSGISDTSCVKISSEHILTLPGGYALPVILIEEQLTYSLQEAPKDAGIDAMWLSDACDQYLQNCLVAGKILDKECSEQIIDNNIVRVCLYTCSELIGEFRSEELNTSYGKRD